jgi:hypothetical protein
MAKAGSLSELTVTIQKAYQCVDAALPLLVSTTGAPVPETERMDRLNLRGRAFGPALTELLDNEYE